MIRALIAGLAYAAAPKATFAVLHPRTAVELKKLPFDLRYAYAPRLTALAAAIVTLPLGVLLGRTLQHRGAGAGARPRRSQPPPVPVARIPARQGKGEVNRR
jgi:hypothetical protein